MAYTSAKAQRQLLDKIVFLTSDSDKDVASSAVDVLIDSINYGVTDWHILLLALNSPHEEVTSKVINTLESIYKRLPGIQKSEFTSSLFDLAENKPKNLALPATNALIAIAKEYRQYDILLRLLNNPCEIVVQKAYASLCEAWEDREAVRVVKEYETADDNVKRLVREIKTTYNKAYKAYYHSAVMRAVVTTGSVLLITFRMIYFISPIVVTGLGVFLYWNSYERASSPSGNVLSAFIGIAFRCFIPILTIISFVLLVTLLKEDDDKSKAIIFSAIALLWMFLYWLSRF